MLKTLIVGLGLTASVAGFGQTTKPALQQVKSDPKTAENAAKADVQQVNKKSVIDGPEAKTLFPTKRQPSPKKRKRLPRKSS